MSRIWNREILQFITTNLKSNFLDVSCGSLLKAYGALKVPHGNNYLGKAACDAYSFEFEWRQQSHFPQME